MSAAADKYSSHGVAPGAPQTDAAAVVPSDTVDLAFVTRGLYVGVAGDVVADLSGSGTQLTFKAMASGVIHPLRIKRVRATGTTATNLVAVW